MKIDVNEIEMEIKEERPAELPDGVYELFITDSKIADSYYKDSNGNKTTQKNGERIDIVGIVNHNGMEYTFKDWINYIHPDSFVLKNSLIRLSELVFACRGYEEGFDTDDVPKLVIDCNIMVRMFTTIGKQSGKPFQNKSYYTFKGKHRSGIEIKKYKDTVDKPKQVEPDDLPF